MTERAACRYCGGEGWTGRPIQHASTCPMLDDAQWAAVVWAEDWTYHVE